MYVYITYRDGTIVASYLLCANLVILTELFGYCMQPIGCTIDLKGSQYQCQLTYKWWGSVIV